MASPLSASLQPVQNRYKISISRRRNIRAAVDEQRILPVLPKEIPDRTWSEILAKEEEELIIFDIREEIYDEAMRWAYEAYLERQLSPFTIFCASQAWIKLVDWAFYRHDPGEDPTNYPPCYIPKRAESWIPDKMPDPSPKDTWAKQKLCCDEDTTVYPIKQWPSNSSLDMPVIDDIPEQFWFPGKCNLPRDTIDMGSLDTFNSQMDDAKPVDSEVLQKVTDYNSEVEEPTQPSGTPSLPKPTTPISRPDSSTVLPHRKMKHSNKSIAHLVAAVGKPRTKSSVFSRSDGSNLTLISDCQVKNPRLDTTYELSSEIIEQPEINALNVNVRKKKD